MELKEFVNYSIIKKFENCIIKFKENINKINFNINIKLFDYLKIKETENITQKPISSLSYIKLDEEKNIIINPINTEDLKKIEECIKKSELKLSFINTGKYIKVIKTQLTSEKKKNILKLLKKETELAKISIRNIRQKLNEEIKNLFTIKKNKNELNIKLKETQKLTDKYISEIDKIYKNKLIILEK